MDCGEPACDCACDCGAGPYDRRRSSGGIARLRTGDRPGGELYLSLVDSIVCES